jgi:P-type Ca2+ transporter type 2C
MDLKAGLTSEKIQELLSQYGENVIASKKKKSPFKLLVEQYTNVITLILFIAAIFSFAIHEIVDASFILFVLVANGIFGFLQEYRAERALEKLQNLFVPMTRVIRDGAEKEIEARFLVPGDIVVLREGDRIPADGSYQDTLTLVVDESIFTGESMPVEKKNGDGLLAGTFIVQSRGMMRVEKTGNNSKLGSIASEMAGIEKAKTPLAENLDQLGKRLAMAVVACSLLLLPIGLYQGRALKELGLTVVSLAVAVIPEGLPLVVTVALAFGAYRMAQKRTIVRKMSAIETLGAATAILADKTGTLTQNNMSVKKSWLVKKEYLTPLLRAGVLANTAEFTKDKNADGTNIVGDKTDAAFLKYAQSEIKDFEGFLKEGTTISEKSFDAKTKTIEAVWKNTKGKEFTFVRGAPENVLKLCIGNNGEAENKIDEFAQEGLRVIGFAKKEKGKKSFTFLGLLGIYDPPRLEAKDAIAKAHEAGIRVVMVTGDNPVTALSIGQEIGLINTKEAVLTTDDLAKLSDEQLKEKISTVHIFARMQPHDKLRLVRLFKSAGYIVAVTGDGVNDALALAESNIGVAMGQSGTDVAKEAADIVITDDNLATIVTAVDEGRAIYHNIVKTVVFLVLANLTEFFMVFGAIVMGLPVPITPTQILWLNLVSDGLPALALATDVNIGNFLKEKPRNVAEQILNEHRLLKLFCIGLPFAAVLLILFMVLLTQHEESYARFWIFNIFVVGEMILVFVIRGSLFPINRLLLISVLASLALQALIIFNPFLHTLFS